MSRPDHGPLLSRRAATAAIAAAVGAPIWACSAAQAEPAVRIEDHGGGVAVSDNCEALKRALAALGSAGGTVEFGAGIYRFASASLGYGGIQIPPNTTIQGQGKGTTRLVVTGSNECYFFLNEHSASNHLISNLTARGNGIATAAGPGGFYYCSVLGGTATAEVSNCRLQNVRLENFGGDYWVRFLCTHPVFAIRACGLEAGCEARSERGNARGPGIIGVTSFIVEFAGINGVVEACFVRGLSADLDYVKGGIAAFGAVRGLQIRAANLRNAFQAYRIADKGAYAILLYDRDGVVTDTTIEEPTITNPFSCGLYIAGTKRTRIESPRISGQADRVDTSLPKAAIALNGANNVRITNPDLHDNMVDFDIAGISEDGFDWNMDIVVEGGSGRDATDCGVKIKASAFVRLCGGIHFRGYSSITNQPRASGMAWSVATDRRPAGVTGFEWNGGECSGGPGGYDIDFNRFSDASQPSGDILLTNLRTAGRGVVASIKAIGYAGGPIRLVNVRFDGTANVHIHVEGNPDLQLSDISFNAAASSGAHTNLAHSRVTMDRVRSAVGGRI